MKKLLFMIALIIPFTFFAQEEIEDVPNSDEVDAALMEAMSSLFNSTAEMKETYNYKGLVRMKTEIDKESSVSLEMWMGEDDSYGMKGMPGDANMTDAFVVFEPNNGAMFICANEGGVKYAMSMGVPGGKKEKEIEKIELVKKKGKKKILGYDCREYYLKGEMKSYTYWITTEESAELRRFASAMVAMEIFKKAESLGDYGVILAMEEENHFVDMKEYVEVEELDFEASYTFDASQYEVMNMKELMEMQESMEGVPQE